MKPRATQAFSEGESFTVAGVALARNSAVIEAGLDLQATRKTRVGLAYQGLLSGSARDHGVRANLTVRFRRGRLAPFRRREPSVHKGRRTDSAFQEILGIFLDLLQRLRQQWGSPRTRSRWNPDRA